MIHGGEDRGINCELAWMGSTIQTHAQTHTYRVFSFSLIQWVMTGMGWDGMGWNGQGMGLGLGILGVLFYRYIGSTGPSTQSSGMNMMKLTMKFVCACDGIAIRNLAVGAQDFSGSCSTRGWAC